MTTKFLLSKLLQFRKWEWYKIHVQGSETEVSRGLKHRSKKGFNKGYRQQALKRVASIEIVIVCAECSEVAGWEM